MVTKSHVEFLNRKEIKPSLLRGELEGGAMAKLDAFLLHQMNAAVDDGLVEFEIRYTIAEQATSRLVLLEDSNRITHSVEGIGCSKSGRTRSNNGHLLAIPYRCYRLDISLAEGCLNDGTLVLAVGSWLMVEAIEHTGFLAQCRTDAPCKLRERVGAAQQSIGQFPVTFIQRVVPFGCFVAQRTGPVAERHATVHAARCLQLAFASAQRLFHLAKVMDSVMNWTIARFLAGYGEKRSLTPNPSPTGKATRRRALLGNEGSGYL